MQKEYASVSSQIRASSSVGSNECSSTGTPDYGAHAGSQAKLPVMAPDASAIAARQASLHAVASEAIENKQKENQQQREVRLPCVNGATPRSARSGRDVSGVIQTKSADGAEFGCVDDLQVKDRLEREMSQWRAQNSVWMQSELEKRERGMEEQRIALGSVKRARGRTEEELRKRREKREADWGAQKAKELEERRVREADRYEKESEESKKCGVWRREEAEWTAAMNVAAEELEAEGKWKADKPEWERRKRKQRHLDNEMSVQQCL